MCLFEIFTARHAAWNRVKCSISASREMIAKKYSMKCPWTCYLLHPEVSCLDGKQMLFPSWAYIVIKIYFFLLINLLGRLEPWCDMLSGDLSAWGWHQCPVLSTEPSARSLKLPRKIKSGRPQLLHWAADKSSTSVAEPSCFLSCFIILLGEKWAGWGLAVWELLSISAFNCSVYFMSNYLLGRRRNQCSIFVSFSIIVQVKIWYAAV